MSNKGNYQGNQNCCLKMTNVTIFNTGAVERFLVSDVKAPLMQGLNALFDGSGGYSRLKALWRAYKAMRELPEPTKENTYYPNTKLIIELRDEFFSLENNPSRHKAFRTIWNFVIILYDYDRYYRHRIDWVIEKMFKLVNMGLWQPRESQRPLRHWKEFEPINESAKSNGKLG